mgnify:CR=1 FL=1
MLIEMVALAKTCMAPLLAAVCLIWTLWLLLVVSAAFRRLGPGPHSSPTEDDLAFLRRLHIRF